jgi:FHS family L-fucose permease-like MFS transporter
MFPTIFALGIKGLGTRTKTGGALIVMSIIGGALVTLAMGRLADSVSIAAGYLVPAVCFVGIGLYAWLGSQSDPEETASEQASAVG